MSVSSDPLRQSQQRWWTGIGIAVLFTLLAFKLYLEHQTWPAIYHHDEPSKVEQIRDNRRNLHHPLLLLEATDWMRRISGIDRTDEVAVTTLGRTLSAACMALAIGVIALAAYWRHSWIAALTVGVLSLIYFRFYEVAHYFKEDTPQLLGLSLVMLTGFLHARLPSTRSIIALGAAVGFAMSSKYAGAGFIAIVVPLALIYPGGMRWSDIVTLLLSAMGVVLIIHLRFLLMDNPFATLQQSLTNEVRWMIHGHKGIGTEIPNWRYAERLKFDLGMHGALLMLLWFPFVKRLHKVDFVMLAFAMIYIAILTVSRKYSERYLLPISFIVFFYVGLQLANLISYAHAKGRKRPWITAAAAIGLMTMVLVPWLPWLEQYRQAFARDSRLEMALFLKDHLPSTATIAIDESVRLNTAQAQAGHPLTRQLQAVYVPELGSLSELRNQGVTHVIICYDSYYQFLADGMGAHGGTEDAWQHARDFYHALKSSGPALWSSEPRNPKPLHPGLEVYAMPAKL